MDVQQTQDPGFYLSAARSSGGRSQLFRPKNLNEFVFNRVGLVMYHLFWVKFGVNLAQRGVNPIDQSELLLWTTEDSGEIDPTESVLYYSLCSHYDEQAENTHPGSTVLRGWLLQGQDSADYGYYGGPYDRLIDEFQTLQADPDSYDFENITDGVLDPWIRTRCHEREIDIEERLASNLYTTITETEGSENEQITTLIATFVTTLGDIVHSDPELYEHKDTNPILQDLQVAEMLSETGHEALSKFGNTNIRFTHADATALFDILKTFEKGRRLIHSFGLMAYLNPTANAIDTNRLRDIYQIYTDHPDEVTERATERLGYDLEASVTAGMESTSFYYLFNFFLTDCETISRKFLADKEESERITTDDLTRFLNRERATLKQIDHFERFLDYSTVCEKYLPGLSEAYESDEYGEIATFLNHVQTELTADNTPSEILLNILTHRETLTQVDGKPDTYEVNQEAKNTNAASFYGVNQVSDWTRTVIKATADD
jgi:hypothetical protein